MYLATHSATAFSHTGAEVSDKLGPKLIQLDRNRELFLGGLVQEAFGKAT